MGRDLALERAWRKRMREYERSGLTIRQLSEQEEVVSHQLSWWRSELKRRDGKSTSRDKSGSLFVFVNERGNRIKLLYGDRDGYAIRMKRLESETLDLPRADVPESNRLKITASELSLILEGIELSSVRSRK